MSKSLADRLPDLMLRDQRRLRRRLAGVRKAGDKRAVTEAIAKEIEAAERRIAARRAAVPKITYPAALPVSQRKDKIKTAIRDNQVVIVAGETGSGKTTQLPKICLELGRGIHGVIGHTQPRRLAARTVADRIAEELNTPVGETVGFKVRFTDKSGDRSLIKLMTDGILLAELQHDRQLAQYDTIIIDEAHERSLNIDFLLGYIKRLLPERPDLKVVITSATIDPERFAEHFGGLGGSSPRDEQGGGAPIVEVSGRTYPVEVRHRPLGDEDDQIQGISDAVDELTAEGPGDILVFLSGEREIRDTADALAKRRSKDPHGPAGDTEVLPLYARLSAAEQHRVFQPHRSRRIVLATNVAETSLTVPGIKYVIDPGTARISRYSNRLKVQRLPIERISRASADQRKGRCGRTSDGLCVRLYSEEDFAGRPEFTDPEILRTNLASVILQMAALRLGDIADFPFVEPPDRRQVKDGVLLLQELGALTREGDLTPLGRRLAQLPVDPRLGRMVLEADKNGCVHEVMVITAALSIQDPRERPADRQQAADEKHARFKDPESDFTALLNLWNHLQERQRALSSSQFRRMCKQEFLHYLRVREWQDVYGQLRQIARELGVTVHSAPAKPYAVHVSLLAGLLSHIGLYDPERREYLGARNARFAVFPGSGLHKRPPRWIMSAELVETSRLFARVNAKIEPEWVEPLAGHLLKRTYSEPHWEKKPAAVMAYEKVTLYGVPIVAQRKVNYSRIAPELARDLFIRHALVEGDWDAHHAFLKENRRLLDDAEELEHRARRRGIVVDDETLFGFYDERIPADVVSGRHFDRWWKTARRDRPELLTFSPEMLVNDDAARVSEEDHPGVWHQGSLSLPLTYQFEPGADADGVTVHIPLRVLNQVTDEGFDWQIPGLREELVTALIKSLPKPVRRAFVPAPEHARRVLVRLAPSDGRLLDVLSREMDVPFDAWDLGRVPDHLKMTFRVEDDRGRRLAEDKDLAALKRSLKPEVRSALSEAAGAIERTGLRTWDVGRLPATIEKDGVKGYPALSDEKTSVAVRTFETEAQQRAAMWAGVRRLILLNAPSPAKFILARLSNQAKLVLSSYGKASELFDDCIACAADKLIAEAGGITPESGADGIAPESGADGPAWDEDGYRRLYDHVRADLADVSLAVVREVEKILSVAQAVRSRLKTLTSPVLRESVTDAREQLDGLVRPGFVTATGWHRLRDLHRYLLALERRLTKLPEHPRRDIEWAGRVAEVREAYDELLERLQPSAREAPAVREIRWMIEELRVSLFAQTIGTPMPVSEKRILRAIADLAP